MTYFRFMWMLIVVAAVAGCSATSSSVSESANTAQAGISGSETAVAAETTTATLYVNGLTCPFCQENINSQLGQVPGVNWVTVELETGKVDVALSPDNPPSEQMLRQAVDQSGFTLDRIQMP